MLRSILIAIFLLAGTAVLVGTTAPSRPLPPTVLEAKTIYVDNRTGIENLTTKAISELKSWGRFSVVSDPANADIILTITTNTKLNPDTDDDRGDLTLQLLIPHDDIPQFSYSQDTEVRFMEAEVSKCIKILRKRIDDQERSKAGSTSRHVLALAK